MVGAHVDSKSLNMDEEIHSLIIYSTNISRAPAVVQQVKNLIGSTRMQVWSLPLISGLRISCCCKLQHRLQMWLVSSVALAMVWTAATVLIQLLAQELPDAMSTTLKGKKKVFLLWGHGREQENKLPPLKMLLS